MQGWWLPTWGCTGFTCIPLQAVPFKSIGMQWRHEHSCYSQFDVWMRVQSSEYKQCVIDFWASEHLASSNTPPRCTPPGPPLSFIRFQVIHMWALPRPGWMQICITPPSNQFTACIRSGGSGGGYWGKALWCFQKAIVQHPTPPSLSQQQWSACLA